MNTLNALFVGNNPLYDRILSYFPNTAKVEDETAFLETMSYQRIDLIFFAIDLELSFSLLERVRMIKKSILSVIISNQSDSSFILKAMRLGATDFLIQPFETADLEGMIRRVQSSYMHHKRLFSQNLLLNQYKNALDASLIISKTDPSGQITYVNDKMIQISGFSASEIIGQTHRLFKHPDTPKEQMQELWQTISSKRVWHGTIINRTKAGESYFTDTFILPLLNEKYEIVEYMDMRIDVTSLYAQKRYVQQIMDSQSAIITVFEEGKIHQCNRRFLEFFETVSLETFYECHLCFHDVIESHSPYLDGIHFKQWLLSDSNVHDVKIALKNPLDELRIFNAVKSSLQSGEESVQAIVTLTDITEMENYLQNLQEKINEATREIRDQQQQLIAQSRAAALGEMFDNIAHQWRQPIGAINNAIINAEFAMELGEVSQENVLETFKQINTYTAFLSKTIDDFRNFSNPDKEKNWFKVHDAITNTIDIIRGAYEMNGIHLNYTPDFTSQEREIYGPQGEFSQVVLNILSNARDAIKEKKLSTGNVTITLHSNDDEIRVDILDNGGGIPEKVLPKIFDPYFSTKNKAQGTGIGLYMSKTIIEKHFGGRLEATNKNEGACFSITLPLEIVR
ncbi:MAG: ATP-binding protein [Sulfuricurvum sp.]